MTVSFEKEKTVDGKGASWQVIKKMAADISRGVCREAERAHAKASPVERAVRRGGTDRGQLHNARRMARALDGRIQETTSVSEHIYGI